jgi:hypothetical protein
MIRDHANETPPRGHSQAGFGTIPGPLVTAPRMSDLPFLGILNQGRLPNIAHNLTAPNGRAWARSGGRRFRAAADRGGSRVRSCQRQAGWFRVTCNRDARTHQAKITKAFMKCSRVSNFEQTRACYEQRVHHQGGVVTEVAMSESDQFLKYAEEALLWVSQSKTEREKQLLCTWTRAAVASERTMAVNGSPAQARL